MPRATPSHKRFARGKGRERGGEGASDVSELTIFADGASLADLTTRANMFLVYVYVCKSINTSGRSAMRERGVGPWSV